MNPCPASPAKNAESGSDTGLLSLLRELVDSQILLAARIEAQTEAIQALADSNMMVVQAMAQDQGMDEQPVGQYLDGSLVR